MNDPKLSEFEQANQEPQTGVIREFIALLKENKKFWLIPLLLAFLGIGTLIILGATSAAPFIYTLF